MAHLFSSMRATCTPGTSRRASGMLVAPERRMSSCVMTKMAAAASATFCVRLDTDVTCMFIRSSTLMVVTSIAFCAGALATNSSATMASATARRTCVSLSARSTSP